MSTTASPGSRYLSWRGPGGLRILALGLGFRALCSRSRCPSPRSIWSSRWAASASSSNARSSAAGIANATVLNARSEEIATGEGRDSYDAVTARAVGRLSTLAELASPLLKENGVLVAWKGKRDPDEEQQLERARPTSSPCTPSESSTSATALAASIAIST